MGLVCNYDKDCSMSTDEFVAYIGIDWADRKHDVCLREANSSRSEHAILKHSPEEIEEWAMSLRKRFSGKLLAVCLEQSRGALIAALLKYDFFLAQLTIILYK